MSKKNASNAFADVPVMNVLQLGGIETSVLDNGPGRDVRIAWVNTGGGPALQGGHRSRPGHRRRRVHGPVADLACR